MKKKYFNLVAAQIIISIFIYFLSVVIYPLRTAGDELIYRKVYEGSIGLSFLEGMEFYQGQIASLEIFHFIFIYYSSNIGFEKDIAFGFFNAVFCILIIKLLSDYFNNLFLIFPLLISNYYFLSLCFTLERLKVGVFFLLLLLIFNKNLILRSIFFILSVTSHFSLIIFFILRYFIIKSDTILTFLRLFKLKIKFIPTLIFIFFAFIFFIYFYNQILAKAAAYLFQENLADAFISMFKTTIFLFISIFASRGVKFSQLITFIPLILGSFLIEPSRINFFAYLFMLYFVINSNDNKRKLSVILLSSLYFSMTGILYIIEIYNHGG